MNSEDQNLNQINDRKFNKNKILDSTGQDTQQLIDSYQQIQFSQNQLKSANLIEELSQIEKWKRNSLELIKERFQKIQIQQEVYELNKPFEKIDKMIDLITNENEKNNEEFNYYQQAEINFQNLKKYYEKNEQYIEILQFISNQQLHISNTNKEQIVIDIQSFDLTRSIIVNIQIKETQQKLETSGRFQIQIEDMNFQTEMFVNQKEKVLMLQYRS